MADSAHPGSTIDPSIDPGEVAKFSALRRSGGSRPENSPPCTSSTPFGWALSGLRLPAIFAAIPAPCAPSRDCPCWISAAAGACCPSPWPGWGFTVTGADASEKNIGTARAHAAQSGVSIDYRATTAEALVAEGASFDVVLNMEVVEHVADVPAYLAACAALVKPGGLTLVATMNKTLKSLALAKIGAEYVLGWLPRGTHDWNRFIPPAELKAALQQNGLTVLKTQGVSFNPLIWDWTLSSDVDVNYMVVAARP